MAGRAGDVVARGPLRRVTLATWHGTWRPGWGRGPGDDLVGFGPLLSVRAA